MRDAARRGGHTPCKIRSTDNHPQGAGSKFPCIFAWQLQAMKLHSSKAWEKSIAGSSSWEGESGEQTDVLHTLHCMRELVGSSSAITQTCSAAEHQAAGSPRSFSLTEINMSTTLRSTLLADGGEPYTPLPIPFPLPKSTDIDFLPCHPCKPITPSYRVCEGHNNRLQYPSHSRRTSAICCFELCMHFVPVLEAAIKGVPRAQLHFTADLLMFLSHVLKIKNK